ncbi:uncharacterized protein BO66DRAFT_442337 [Aspergillus aculeatinus CBS 121060]|uniref:Uncharacterized protein n=1 Tax=Aspergillus aculeatinus CBS 121060 TaxID=1448322 RepID=A0ACD1GYA3_9EURO|nr:hypothetical protein BO66DRAFT_442337 [Aspergillus aculeatinus CBS 121060]RAH66122.1 hypothetical protein BO66DRAFT_442337 [Aspergillus aculeatinus CBS 121060]
MPFTRHDYKQSVFKDQHQQDPPSCRKEDLNLASVIQMATSENPSDRRPAPDGLPLCTEKTPVPFEYWARDATQFERQLLEMPAAQDHPVAKAGDISCAYMPSDSQPHRVGKLIQQRGKVMMGQERCTRCAKDSFCPLLRQMAPSSNSKSPTPQAEPWAQSADSTSSMSETSTKPTSKILSAKTAPFYPTTPKLAFAQPATAQPRSNKGKTSSILDIISAEQVGRQDGPAQKTSLGVCVPDQAVQTQDEAFGNGSNKVPLLEPPPRLQGGMDKVTEADGRIMEAYYHRPYGGMYSGSVRTGDWHTLSTPDATAMPLPSCELLRMQVVLTRILRLSGEERNRELWTSREDGKEPEYQIEETR